MTTFNPHESLRLAEAANAYCDNAAEVVMYNRFLNEHARTALPEACWRLIRLRELLGPGEHNGEGMTADEADEIRELLNWESEAGK